MHNPAHLNAALAYAAHGWPVFLLGRSKRPLANCADCRDAGSDHDREACVCLTCHGFYAATTDPDRITALCSAVPNGLLAIRTGALAGLVVIDVDPGHGGRVDRTLMPSTRCVATGNHGWHLYYNHPGRTVVSRPMPGRPGIDIKADGGYVVAPPSVHPVTGRAYRLAVDRVPVEMPPPLLDACQPPAPTPTAREIRPRGGEGITNPAALLAAHLNAVARAPEGQRRTTLYGAARGVGRMVAAGALTAAEGRAALVDAGRAAQQTDRDIHAAITAGFTAEGAAA